jgi:hypothetical protein
MTGVKRAHEASQVKAHHRAQERTSDALEVVDPPEHGDVAAKELFAHAAEGAHAGAGEAASAAGDR